MKYRDYLKSEHWKTLKKRKQKTVPRRCAICASSDRVALHHLFYRTPWEAAELSDLRWLCQECHYQTHGLIRAGSLKFPRPDNHNSCFVITKHAVKTARGLGMRNLFAEADQSEKAAIAESLLS